MRCACSLASSIALRVLALSSIHSVTPTTRNPSSLSLMAVRVLSIPPLMPTTTFFISIICRKVNPFWAKKL